MYALWWLVNALEMKLLSQLLNAFVNVGIIIIIIIFQPEVRRFLLMLGSTTLQRHSSIFNRFFNTKLSPAETRQKNIQAIKTALLQMSKQYTGALIVLSDSPIVNGVTTVGQVIDARISRSLIESIFNKLGPLHDGALIIANNRIHSTGAILPISDNAALPKNTGLRHRAGVGISEISDVHVFIVSEENGEISFAHKGKLESDIDAERIEAVLGAVFI